MAFSGVHTALVTPFDDTGAVDRDAYRRLARRQLAAGIHGLVACGTTGETPTLTGDEWAHAIQDAVEVAGDQAPVTAGVGTNSTASTVDLVQRAARMGADAGLLVFPYYNKPNPRGLRQHVRAAAEPGLPLVLYHVPGRTGQHLPPRLLAELAELDGVVAIKEATGDVRYAADVMRHTDTPLLSGDDFSFLQGMAAGSRGVVSVVSNVAPAHTVAIYEHFVAGRTAQAAAALRELWDLIVFLFSDTNPVPCKAAMAHLGLCSDRVRLPLAPYEGASPGPILEGLGLAS